MSIDWLHFSPLPATVGGLLIGLAAAMLVLLNGRIAGVSGILGGALSRPGKDTIWRLAFILGLVAAPLLYTLVRPVPVPHVAAGPWTLVVAGLLVGLGTRYGAGCTSGHGVCGLSRLSPRSLVATLAFMLAGFATVFALRHLLA
jgi:uncharacterized membrane protein YedE/YeeE